MCAATKMQASKSIVLLYCAAVLCIGRLYLSSMEVEDVSLLLLISSLQSLPESMPATAAAASIAERKV